MVNPASNHYTGPLTFMTLLYLRSTRCDDFDVIRQRPLNQFLKKFEEDFSKKDENDDTTSIDKDKNDLPYSDSQRESDLPALDNNDIVKESVTNFEVDDSSHATGLYSIIEGDFNITSSYLDGLITNIFDECGWDAETSPRTRHPAFSSLYQFIQSFSFDAPGLFRLRANCASSSIKTRYIVESVDVDIVGAHLGEFCELLNSLQLFKKLDVDFLTLDIKQDISIPISNVVYLLNSLQLFRKLDIHLHALDIKRDISTHISNVGLEGVIGDVAVKKNKANRAGCGRGASANVLRVLLWSLVTNQMI
ncbi:hypothetical protein Tco_0790866 [Tanacetum coccineum]